MDHAAELLRRARIAADPDAPARQRVEALVAIVEGVSIHGLPIPDAAIDAVDDPALLDAAIALKQTGAICAALHQLGRRPELESTRKRVVKRLVASGASGTNLAALAFEIGDVASGASLAARDHDLHLAARVAGPVPNAIVDAWLGWLCDQTDAAVVATLRTLQAKGTELAQLFAHGTDRRRIARLEQLAQSMLRS